MTRVLIGPANHAGQAAEWVAALRGAGVQAASLSFRAKPRLSRASDGSFGFHADDRLPFPKLTTSVGRRRRAHRLAGAFTHVALDGYAPVVGSVRAPLGRGELDQWKAWGVSLALIAHGSDIRDPGRHTRTNPSSYFPLLDSGFRDWLAVRSASNRALAEESGLPLFVSTPDLLLDLPDAVWLPLSVDQRRWGSTPRPQNSRPRVLHAPSSGMRGTEIIDPVLRDLEAKGRLEYIRPSHVPHKAMPALVASVDVVVDQIRSGFYGVTAVEAMTSRALVVGHVSPAVRALLPEDPGIIDATPETFEATMHSVLDCQRSWPESVSQAAAYAERWHNGRASARALDTFVSSG